MQRACCFGGVGMSGIYSWCRILSALSFLDLIQVFSFHGSQSDEGCLCVCVCVYMHTRMPYLISHSSSGLPKRKAPLSSVVPELRFLGLNLSESHPASSVNIPKVIGLWLSGMKARRRAQPVTVSSWTAQAEPWPRAFTWKKSICVQGTEWVGC